MTFQEEAKTTISCTASHVVIIETFVWISLTSTLLLQIIDECFGTSSPHSSLDSDVLFMIISLIREEARGNGLFHLIFKSFTTRSHFLSVYKLQLFRNIIEVLSFLFDKSAAQHCCQETVVQANNSTQMKGKDVTAFPSQFMINHILFQSFRVPISEKREMKWNMT